MVAKPSGYLLDTNVISELMKPRPARSVAEWIETTPEELLYLSDMLEYRADQQETTVSGVLARELDGIASAHIEELSAALPGFAEAMAWPDG